MFIPKLSSGLVNIYDKTRSAHLLQAVDITEGYHTVLTLKIIE